ncbi:hybrid sensor histidine kinase/response regulator [uncultured Maritalea sp.]|jgi:two-component system chemotaxis sensor kinase CheA|uniref:hybrid sensor histidine kinase/response regulator n=1 Tax=uncultured Maritalea sp. TaxID=757249 RepID=UPI0026235499|nr:hybrid sensor histidine kinase/response regulator [uncultured Maritalea sp.]
MDELLSDFLTETAESIEQVDAELVDFEKHPDDQEILRRIFRLVHTIKGTCGFLDLPRLEALTHAAENLMGQYRDGAPVIGDGVETILNSIDRVKVHLDNLAETGVEPEGDDLDLIDALNRLAAGPNHEDCFAQDPLHIEKPPLDPLEVAFLAAPGPDDIDDVPEAAAAEPLAAKPVEKTKASGANIAAPLAIRVQLPVLEGLMTMVSELVLTRNQLMAISRGRGESEFNAPLQRLCSVTAELQDGVMKTRMQPISAAWQKMPRLIRDLSKDLGKEISLEMSGEDTELDRQILEQIKDPLTHMVRNAADHGLEDQATRQAAGKTGVGTVRLNAFHEGGQIVIEIVDDGRGLDVEALRSKALDKDIVSEAELAGMNDGQVQQLIFHPGFSTASEVTSVSGRGVGMDVVRSNVELIGGTIDLKSQVGVGTTVSLKIPLTLAIVPALIIAVGQERFALPQRAVRELVRVNKKANKVERLNGSLVLQLRDHLLPVVGLSDLLGMRPGEVPDEGYVVVTEVGQYCFGLLVDEVFHTEEIVVKPMMGALQGLKHFSGTTILGDGSVIMIMDPSGLASSVAQTDMGDLARTQPVVEELDNQSVLTELLVFEAREGARQAVPLSLVNRLETVKLCDLEKVDGRHLLQYRGALMPINFLCEPPQSIERKMSMLVFEDRGFRLGIVVAQVLDIVADRMEIDVEARRGGYLGTAIIKGRATEILDMAYYMAQEHPKSFDRQADLAQRKRRRLLYAEDSAFYRNMLVPIFKSAGFDVTVCTDGEEAYEALQAGSTFDLIVTDIEMPGMDGFSLAQSVRELAHMAGTPIIALSSYDGPNVQSRAKEVGLFDFVAKGDREHLTRAVSRAMSMRQLEAA